MISWVLAVTIGAFEARLERAAQNVRECVQVYRAMHPAAPVGRPIRLLVSGVNSDAIDQKHAANSRHVGDTCVVVLDQEFVTDPNILAHEVCHCMSWDFDHINEAGWLDSVPVPTRRERERVATACALEVAEAAWKLRVAVAAAKVREGRDR